MVDVFISYSQAERQAIERIAAHLRGLGLSVWFDASMNAGESFNDEIDREARVAKAVLVCWSPAARESRWVKAEAMIGFEHDKLAACYVAGPDGFSPPTPFNTSHAEDMRQWLAAPSETEAAWRSVLRRIGRLCARGDIESWGSLDAQATMAQLRAWTAAHQTSPLFDAVYAQLQTRAAEDKEQSRLQRESRERRERDERLAEREARERRAVADAEQLELTRTAHVHEMEQARRATHQGEQEARRGPPPDATGRSRRKSLDTVAWWAIAGVLALACVSYFQQNSAPVERVEAARSAEHRTGADLGDSARLLRVANGETLLQLLIRAGASPAEAEAAVAAVTTIYDPHRLRPGHSIAVQIRPEGEESHLTRVWFPSEPGVSMNAYRTSDGSFEVREMPLLTFEIACVVTAVGASLSDSALSHGATEREVAALAGAFAYDRDFQRDLQPDDNFELLFERFYDGDGRTVRTGDTLFVSLATRRGRRTLYSFIPPGSNVDWYDYEGRPVRAGRTNLTGHTLKLYQAERNRIDLLRHSRRCAPASSGQ